MYMVKLLLGYLDATVASYKQIPHLNIDRSSPTRMLVRNAHQASNERQNLFAGRNQIRGNENERNEKKKKTYQAWPNVHNVFGYEENQRIHLSRDRNPQFSLYHKGVSAR